MATFGGWEAAVLAGIGAPATKDNIAFLDAWQHAEGGTAANNPLNTTQPATGATDYNSVHVKNYPDATTGAAATAQTLTNGRYPTIVAVLRSGNPRMALAHAGYYKQLQSELNTWGTGSSWLIQAFTPSNAGKPQSPVTGAKQAATDVANATPGVSQIFKDAKSIGEVLDKLGSLDFWLRAGQVAAGAVLILVGLVLLARQIALSFDVDIPTPPLPSGVGGG